MTRIVTRTPGPLKIKRVAPKPPKGGQPKAGSLPPGKPRTSRVPGGTMKTVKKTPGRRAPTGKQY